jgi:electron-transferring-flavoprotein dehydrogenase
MTTQDLLAQFGPRESMDFDVVIVGAGPAGLAAAIRIKQLAVQRQQEVSVVVLEKGAEPGAHILSGAIMDPRALTELLPNWQALGAPLHQPVTQDTFLLLSETGATRVPNVLLPPCFDNHGNYIVSLGRVVQWLAAQAEGLGVEIFSGFAAAEVLYDDNGRVCGVATGDMGLGKNNQPTDRFQLGMALQAKYTLFAEGARGHLGKQLIERFALDAGKDPQSYALGIKELWEIPPERHEPGLALHTSGWPLDADTYGGSFMYHQEDHKVVVGFVVGLDYQNPHLSPYEEFQRFKTHPNIRWYFENAQGQVVGKRLSFGARAITAGGLLALPQTVFPGGALIGCDAGYLNASRIKGSHAAIKSGMLAADAVVQALSEQCVHDTLTQYPQAFQQSWLYAELHRARNFKQWFKYGRTIGTFMTGLEQWVLRGRIPWTLHRTQPDHSCLLPAAQCHAPDYPKPDGVLTFDRLSSVFVSQTNHEENQPAHLTLKDARIPVALNLRQFDGPESRYCPAGVYEYVTAEDQTPRLQINAQNCVHCKSCDIKDPTQNIVWLVPEGGGGPNYSGM